MGHRRSNIFRRASWVAAACATAATVGLGAAAAAQNTTLTTKNVKPGKAIFTSSGQALYLFTGSNCSGSCAKSWPPLIAVGKVGVASGSGLKQSLVGTTHRSDGRVQVTYNHHALYEFTSDKRGQIKGEGASVSGGKFYLVSPSGKALKKKSSGSCNPLCQGY